MNLEWLTCSAAGGMTLLTKVDLSKVPPESLLHYPLVRIHFVYSSTLAPFCILLYHCSHTLGHCTVFTGHYHFQSGPKPLGTTVSPGHWHDCLTLLGNTIYCQALLANHAVSAVLFLSVSAEGQSL